MFRTFILAVGTFCREASFHGLNSLVNPIKSMTAKRLWLMTLLMVNLVFVYLSVKCYQEYIIEDPVATEVKFNSHEYLNFPQLLVCPVFPDHKAFVNWFPPSTGGVYRFIASLGLHFTYAVLRGGFQKNISEVFEKFPYLEEHYQRMVYLDQIPPFLKSLLNIKDTLQETLEFARDHPDTTSESAGDEDDMWDAYLVDFEEMFLACSWKGENCLNRGSNVYWTVVNTVSGPCYKFSANDTKIHGPWDSLELTLMMNASNGDPLAYNDLQIYSYLLPPGEPITTENYKMQMKWQPGMSHVISLQQFDYEDVSGKYPCEELGAQNVLRYGSEYSYYICIQECTALLQASVCNCSSAQYAMNYSKICGIFDAVLCVPGGANYDCKLACKLQCSFTQYTYQRQFAKFPSAHSLGQLKSLTGQMSLSHEYWAQNGMEVKIHFSSLVSRKFKVAVKYSFLDKIAAFGSLAGWCLGAGLFAVFEVFFFVCESSLHWLVQSSWLMNRKTSVEEI